MKRRFLLILLAAALLLCLAACRKNPQTRPEEPDTPDVSAPVPEVFPTGTVICGVDISDLTPQEAKQAVEERISDYSFTLQLGESTFEFTNEILHMEIGSLDYEELLKSCLSESGVKVVDDIFTYDISAVRNLLEVVEEDAVPAENAYLSFCEEEEAFVLMDEKHGTQFDLEAVLRLAENAVLDLQDTLTLGVEEVFYAAEITAESEEAQAALAKANGMLNTTLTYTYQPGTQVLGTQTVDREKIRDWLLVEEDGLTVVLDPGPVNEYVTDMYETYSLSNNYSTFVTSRGEEIQLRVPSPGETVDTDALYNSIVENIQNASSGAYDAPYIPEDEDFTADFGGNYVEIDLSGQHLWVYNNGVKVVDTDIVSGCVNTGHATPAGIYTIKAKETERYLIGPDYKSWVNYWMPFNGGIGLHDADGWRWSYGGGIYLYSGSHGCINMPYSAAAKTYENVSVGTYVILYGGVTSVAPLEQSVSGTSSYTVKEGDGSFKLDAKPYYKIDKMTYSSSDPSVVTVSSDGTVTIVGPGTATITVTAVAETGYTEATLKVSVTVNSKCSQGEHSWDDGKVTTEPSCNVEGIRTYTCKECQTTKTESISKTDHTSDQGTETSAVTCGNDGVKIFCCTVCGEEIRKEITPATGNHTPDEGVITTQPGCVTDGVRTFSCTVCGKVVSTEAVPAPGSHTEDAGTVTTQPTCTAEGVKTVCCTVCGEVISTEAIPATGSHTEDAGTVTTQPTCTAEGVRTYSCTDCGTPLRTETIPALGHTPDAGTVFQDSTCTTEGVMTHSCTSCGTAMPNSPIPMKGHNYVDGVCTGCGAPETPQ